MSQPMRAGFRPFGRNTQAPPLSPPPAIPERDESGGLAVSDYMMPRGMSSSGQWLNSQVESFQNARTAPLAPPPHGGSLRNMAPEQRAALMAQRDADNAAARGVDSHKLSSVPMRSSSVTAASFPPVPTMRLSTATVQEAQPAPAGSPSPQPVPEEVDDDPYDAPPQERATIETAQRVPSPLPSPTSLAPPASFGRAPSPEAVMLPPSPARQMSVATLVAAPRPATEAVFPADVEIEVRGVGVERVLTIRLRQLGL